MGLWVGVGEGGDAAQGTEGRSEGLKDAAPSSRPTHCSPLCPQVDHSTRGQKLKRCAAGRPESSSPGNCHQNFI